MLPSDYQRLASRTQCPQPHLHDAGPSGYIDAEEAALLHASIGLASEGGELLGQIQKWIWYKKPLDKVNVKEELGDAFWYIAEACNALGWDMGEVMASNLKKLQIRYPEKYTDYLAAEENRDRSKESKVIRTVSDVLKARSTLDGCCKKFPGIECDCLDTAKLLEGI